MSGRPTFVFEPATNSRDMKTRPAARLCLNGVPTQQFVYSQERARAMVGRAYQVGELSLLVYNQVLAQIKELKQLPEICADFPYISLCQCTLHGALIDADGEDFNIHPAYSQAVLLERLEAEYQAGNIFARDLPKLRVKIMQSNLPLEAQPEDTLAMQLGIGVQLQMMDLSGGRLHILPQGQINWCDIHSLPGRELHLKAIVPEADQDS